MKRKEVWCECDDTGHRFGDKRFKCGEIKKAQAPLTIGSIFGSAIRAAFDQREAEAKRRSELKASGFKPVGEKS